MKVVEKKKGSIIRFDEVKIGEIFEYEETYWMKIAHMLKNEYYGVCVANGKIYDDFEPSDMCRVVEAELHILD